MFNLFLNTPLILALFIQHTMCLCHVTLSPVICLAVLYFSHYLINGNISGKSLLNIKCVYWFSLQLLFQIFLILKRIQQDINVHRSSYKVTIILVKFQLALITLTVFPQISNFRTSYTVGSGLLNMDKQMDNTNL